MASTYSPSLRIELIGTGEQSGTWGDTTNTNLGDLIEQAITGVESIPMTDTDYTLSSLNGSPDEARNAIVIMTSVAGLTASRNVIIPAAEKTYFFKNSTTGGQNLVVKTSSGAGYTVPNGKTAAIYCDGTDCFQSLDYLASPTFSGTPLATTAAYGTNTTQIATTAFVQAALQAIYPVGSVYINAAVNTNPATLLGFGTWVAIGTGQVLVGQNPSDTAFDTLGETGGSKDAVVVSHTHTAQNNGTHSHSVYDPGHAHSTETFMTPSGGATVYTLGAQYWGTSSGTGAAVTNISLYNNGDHTHTINSTGSSGTNANLQPYVVVKMWQRTV